DCLQPDAVHTRRRQACQVTIRVRVQRRIEQRVAIQSEVGVTEPGRESAGASHPTSAGLWRTRQFLNELKQGLLRLADPRGKLRPQNPGNCARAFASASIGRAELQALALGLQVAQLD